MLGLVDNILRGVNFAFFVILLGLVGSLLATQDRHSSRVNYCMFVPAFAIVTDSFYGILANIFSVPFGWPIILFGLNFLNFVFTFTAGTVLSVGVRTHSCTNQRYLDSNGIVQGSTSRCRKAQASIAFFYFSFFIFLAQMVMSGINMLSSGPIAFAGMPSRKHSTANVGVPTSPQVVSEPNISQV